MGQASLNLPDPLLAEPLADARSADDLLSQMAGEEIDRLLAQADLANEDRPDDEAGAGVSLPSTVKPHQPRVESASSLKDDAPQRETAVSSFVAEGDPALEAELDSLLANLNGTPVELCDSRRVSSPGAMDAKSGGARADKAASKSQTVPQASVPRAAETKSSAPAEEPETWHPEPGETGAAEASADPVVTREMDRVFDQMTGPADPAPTIAGPTPTEPAAAAQEAATVERTKEAGSIDLLKVLDPIVARDAAAADEATLAQAAPGERESEETVPTEGRVPIHVIVLEWVNAPLYWLSPSVRDAAGKVAILTLINAAAILLWVLFFRRK